MQYRPRTRLTQGAAAVAAAGALLLGAVACSDADEPLPKDPADTNVETDDILPPGDQRQVDGSGGGRSGGY